MHRILFISAASIGLLQACSADPDASFDRAQAALEKHDYGAVRLDLIEALKAKPDDAAMVEMLARTELALGNGEGALRQLDQLDALGVTLDDHSRLRAEAEVTRGQAKSALTLLEGDKTAEAARIRSLALVQLEKFDEAREALKAGLSASGPKTRLHADYAMFVLVDGEADEARRFANMAMKEAPHLLDPHIALARVEEAAGNWGKALNLYEGASSAFPNSRAAMLGRIRALGELGRIDDAEPLIESAYAKLGQDVDVAFLMARLKAERGDWDEARTILQGKEAELGSYPPAQFLYARALMEVGLGELAYKNLTSLNLRYPGNPDAAGLLAKLKIERGDKAGAVDLLRPIVEGGNAPSEIISLYNSAK
ncbi:tetratricopeptide repeat protein [Pontixanthobacter aquaemixtae]|uniref:Tetratricopeptide repeat protein n=1 Tax=Pontixanthobacter aquaemixtae TaxID=1958940 RepID=A0A844ZT64_9SPHN|nr:tetratricopeptide repeat protein [Pontixanthobacter aquaemixtae]MXO90196.1 tetratricopeptide repeat protein [Pontixanthobacter aquaemixtae]